jgi:hypothetical protein
LFAFVHRQTVTSAERVGSNRLGPALGARRLRCRPSKILAA